jgi:hypothetical protein
VPTHRGGCHCGAVRFEVDGEIEAPDVCNCSICTKTAYVHWEVPPERFRLLTPEDAIRDYRFGTMTSRNLFCATCGISPFRRPRTDPGLIDVNLRCLEGVDADAFEARPFDGRNWEEAAKRR